MADRKAPHGQCRQQPASEAWDTLPWRKLERHVFRIQKRIYRARQRGNIRAVQTLQKLLMKSEAARLLAVRSAQTGHAALADGTHQIHPQRRFALAQEIHPRTQQRSARRAHRPAHARAKTRQGLSTPLARARQALVRIVLEPVCEAVRAPGRSGFHPGRTRQDALEAISRQVRHQPMYVLVLDLRHNIASLNPQALLEQLHASAGLRRMVRMWLQAGMMQDLAPTTNGIPREDILAPLLAQIGLHGMQQAVRDVQKQEGQQPTLIGYADRFVLLHPCQADVSRAASRIARWLADLGLHLDPAHLHITHTLLPSLGRVGFEFLGYSFRHYQLGYARLGQPAGFTTAIQPGKEAIRGHLAATRRKMRELQAVSHEQLIRELNPLIEEWSSYYRFATSADVHARCDHLLHQQLLSWARHRHPKKGRAWVISKYWPDARDHHSWTFGSAHAWIRRHKRPADRYCRDETQRPAQTTRVAASGVAYTRPYTEEPYEGKLSRTVREWRSEERSSRRPSSIGLVSYNLSERQH